VGFKTRQGIIVVVGRNYMRRKDVSISLFEGERAISPSRATIWLAAARSSGQGRSVSEPKGSLDGGEQGGTLTVRGGAGI
jgi:hypothetical protein